MTDEYLQAVEHDSHLNLPSRIQIDQNKMLKLQLVQQCVEAAQGIIDMLTPKPNGPTGGIHTRDGEIIVPLRLMDLIDQDGAYASMTKQTTNDLNAWTKQKRTNRLIQRT